MFSSLKRKTVISMATGACLGAILVSGGCEDTASADRDVADAIASAHALSGAGEAQISGAATVLNERAAAEATSDAAKAHARLTLAQIELQSADQLARQAARHDLVGARIATEILDLAARVQTANLQADALKKLDPGAAKVQIQGQINQARGGAEQAAWLTEVGQGLPTLAAAQQTISKIEGDIAQKQTEINALNEQREAALRVSENAAKMEEAASGEAAVLAYQGGSDARKQASDLGTQIDLLQARLAQLQRDLSIAQGHQQAATTAIAELENQIKSLDEGWQGVQGQIEAQTALARDIVSVSLPPGSAEGAEALAELSSGKSLAARADLLAKHAEEAAKLRAEALAKIDSAQAHLGEAMNAAGRVLSSISSIQNTPTGANTKNALKLGNQTFSTKQYSLAKSAAPQAQGRLHLAAATSAKMRLKLRDAVGPTLQAGAQPIPAALQDANLEKAFTESLELAKSALNTADEELAGITGGSGAVDESAANAALVQSALVRYDLARVALLSGDDAEYQAKLNSAGEQIKLAAEANAPMPIWPTELLKFVPEKSATPTEPAPADQPPTDPPPSEPAPGDQPPADPAMPPAENAAPPADGTTPPPAEPAP